MKNGNFFKDNISCLTLVVFLLAFFTYGQAQERVNIPVPKINKALIGQLVNADGWILNPEGQWISRKNRIPYYLNDQSLIDKGKFGLGIDNFISLQIYPISVKNRNYFVFIKKFKEPIYWTFL